MACGLLPIGNVAPREPMQPMRPVAIAVLLIRHGIICQQNDEFRERTMMSHRLFRWVTVASALLMGHAAQALEPKEIFAKASPSVVVVYAQTVSGKVVQGSGVVLHPGAVATNCHVVTDATKIQIRYGASRVRELAPLI